MVAEHADEWNVPGLPPQRYRDKRTILEGYCGEIGRDPREIARSVTSLFAIGTNTAEIERRTAIREPYAYTWAPADTPSRAEAFRELGWLYGSPEEVVDQLRALEHVEVPERQRHDRDHAAHCQGGARERQTAAEPHGA